jgi:hypothetical protein
MNKHFHELAHNVGASVARRWMRQCLGRFGRRVTFGGARVSAASLQHRQRGGLRCRQRK